MTSSGIWCFPVRSRISRRLASPRKFRRAVLCTSRMSRRGAGPCALRLSFVSPRGSVEPGIRELICVHWAVPNSDGSAPSLRLLVPHGCFSSRWEVEFLFSLLRILQSSTSESSPPSPWQTSRWHTLCMIRLPPVSACSATLRIWFYVSVIGGYRTLRFEEFRREEKFKTSSPVAAHPS